MKISKDFLRLCQNIVRNSLEIGIDAAGEKLCGQSAWKKIKKVLSPVAKELERRFPNWIKLPEEAEKAADALAKDNVLQEMLTNGLATLEEGQEEILAAIARQSRTLAQISDAIHYGFTEAEEKHEAGFERLYQELQALQLQLSDIREMAPEEQISASQADVVSKV